VEKLVRMILIFTVVLIVLVFFLLRTPQNLFDMFKSFFSHIQTERIII